MGMTMEDEIKRWTADEPIKITQAEETAYRTTLDKVLGGADIDIV